MRIPLAEIEAPDREASGVHRGSTPNGRRYFTLAETEIESGNLQAAVRDLQMAITFEPGNAHFKEKLEKLRAQLNS